ncbi:MAG: bifunctional riboflavin kinase/FAD synthetase, partial [Pseudomonadota bacterium]
MDVISTLPVVDHRLRGSVLALGNFDGVHRGHQAVISRARTLAHRLSAASSNNPGETPAGERQLSETSPSARSATVTSANQPQTPWGVLTFEPHPRAFFNPGSAHFRLTPPPLKAAAIQATGADLYVQVGFDAALSRLSPDAFIHEILLEGLGVAGVVIGHDFHFGHRRTGTPDVMAAAGAAHGFEVDVIAPVTDAHAAVFASSAVRAALSAGDMGAARRVLGYGWRVRGEVISGAGRGTGLGYPTANIAMDPSQTVRHGIYAAKVHTHDGTHDAATYFGTRPTYDNGRPLLETFLFDFDRSLYGEVIDVEFVEFLRPDAAFTSSEALMAQMDLDVAAAR